MKEASAIEQPHENITPEKYHSIYGKKNTRISYKDSDFFDYIFMIIITFVIIFFSYGNEHILTYIGLFLCCSMLLAFPIRHGAKFKLPLFIRKPQEFVYTFIYAFKNIPTALLIIIVLLLVENLVIYLTPNLPHMVHFMHLLAMGLFILHVSAVTLFRTVILVDHIRKRDLIQQALSETSWKNSVDSKSSTLLEIFHAYFTGLLAHIMLVSPWYVIITHVNYSIILLPLTLAASVYVINKRFSNEVALWFYREHWINHNCETGFVYNHGPHHDAIPSALIGVSENGFIEGVMRCYLGYPHFYCNPFYAFYTISVTVWMNILTHQYIPNIYPYVLFTRKNGIRDHHAIHHYKKLVPYGLISTIDYNVTVPDEISSNGLYKFIRKAVEDTKNKPDITLNNYDKDNKHYQQYLDLVEKYQTKDFFSKKIHTE